VDNITHTLIGVVLAELAIPRETTRTTTRLFVAAGAIAANAPDLDLIYVGITQFPLGYLLHHRGHTHTLIGLVVQVVLIAAACQLVLRFLEGPGKWRARLWGLIAVALASHVALDACNSYGVHPFYPFGSRWYFGDALFIFEPWLWLVLCLAVGLNIRRRAFRAVLMVPMAVLLVALTFVSVLSVATLAAMIVSSLAVVWWTRSWTSRARAAGAVAAVVLFIGAMSAASAKARADTRELIASEALADASAGDAPEDVAAGGPAERSADGRPGAADRRRALVDIVLTPDPAAPVCWTVIAIERDQEAGTFVTRRGTLSLRPSWQSPERCASHRLTGLRAARRVGDGRLVWSEEIHQPLAAFRDLAARDCRVAAWLQFGRAPVLHTDRLFDLRFEGPRGNFSTMKLAASSCPSNLTNWAMPRADLLD
jgi:inner membrane protein